MVQKNEPAFNTDIVLHHSEYMTKIFEGVLKAFVPIYVDLSLFIHWIYYSLKPLRALRLIMGRFLWNWYWYVTYGSSFNGGI